MTGGNKMESFSKTCRESGMVPGARLLDRKIVPVREDEKAFFGCSEDDLLLYIKRVRTADGRPIFEENLFFPYQEFKSLMQMEWNDTSAFETIRGLTGRWPVDTAHRTIEVTRASAEQAQELNVPGRSAAFPERLFFGPERQTPGYWPPVLRWQPVYV